MEGSPAMVRLALIALAMVPFLVPSPPVLATQPGTPGVDPYGPSAEACRVAPRAPEALRAVLDDAAAEATPPVRGTPTVVEIPPAETPLKGAVALPAGVPADAATAAAVAATARQLHACRNAGDLARYLALFSDAAIRHSAGRSALATVLLTEEVSSPTPGNAGLPRHFPGLFHARVLADGRVAAVAPPGFGGVPELYVFARTEAGWLVDDIAPLVGPDGLRAALSGVVANTYTAERLVSDFDHPDGGGYGYGLAWGSPWRPLVAAEPRGSSSVTVFPGILVLTNGVSLVVLGVPFAPPDVDLAACVSPSLTDLAAELGELGLDQVEPITRAADLVPAVGADGRPLRGTAEGRAFAAYDLAAGAGGTPAATGPYRLFVECRTMAGGGWVLGITHLVPVAAYAAEAPARDQLLAALEG